MTTGHAESGFPTQDLLDLEFENRVDASGISGDRKGLDLVSGNHPHCCVNDFPGIDFLDHGAVDDESSLDAGCGGVPNLSRSKVIVRGDDQQTNLLALPLHHGVGGQGGGDRHQTDLGQACRFQAFEGPGDAQGKVPGRGQGLVFPEGGLGVEIEEHRVGIGPAGVDAQPVIVKRMIRHTEIFPVREH